MRVVEFNPHPTLYSALEALDKLRADLISGQLVGFYAVGLAADDRTFRYIGTVRSVSRLRFLGALAMAAHCFHHDEDEEETDAQRT